MLTGGRLLFLLLCGIAGVWALLSAFLVVGAHVQQPLAEEIRALRTAEQQSAEATQRRQTELATAVRQVQEELAALRGATPVRTPAPTKPTAAATAPRQAAKAGEPNASVIGPRGVVSADLAEQLESRHPYEVRPLANRFWRAKKAVEDFKSWSTKPWSREVLELNATVHELAHLLVSQWGASGTSPGAVVVATPPKTTVCGTNPWLAGYSASELQVAEDHARGVYIHLWELYQLVRDSHLIPHHHVFAPWEPVQPPASACPVGAGGFTRVRGEDSDDAGKNLCGLEVLSREGPDCTVLSLGSKNSFEFEWGILNHTSCTVHVYDCFVDDPKPPSSSRLTFHRVCVGGNGGLGADLDKPHIGLPGLIRELGRNKISLLKMDIEGWERSVFQEAHREWWAGGQLSWLPNQILLELHCCDPNRLIDWGNDADENMDQAESVLLLRILQDFGYRVIAKEPNPYGKAVEVTLMRYLC
eukprot:gnl/TRDRNA2_/TRDRNA2_85084_c0_seq1.p1 gnl/TRDRNA2_/TRDRNA2_85084_c0~~gnl/TRDRNA2_/TRDRNA2_85084_c0_seq1.p1  ORF type:complete len:498 (-),score=85.45 gnl/TRDRNA2_/TRDRNA2_85084_c0_seq1:96-1514(-)